jgi:DNA-dependent RNA polymerase auxiliary subunit epsilon
MTASAAAWATPDKHGRESSALRAMTRNLFIHLKSNEGARRRFQPNVFNLRATPFEH